MQTFRVLTSFISVTWLNAGTCHTMTTRQELCKESMLTSSLSGCAVTACGKMLLSNYLFIA